MIALIRYNFATTLHTQRYLPPVFLFLGLLAVLTVNGGGSLPAAYASAAGALFVSSAWLATAVLGVDDPAQRAIVVVSAGRSLKVLLASVLSVLLGCLVLLVTGLVFPLWMGSYRLTPAGLLLGVEAQLTGACTGIAIGLPCSRLLFRRQGHALLTAVALLMGTLFTQGLPPLNRLLRLMATTDDPARLLAPGGAMLLVAVALLATATAATQFLSGGKP
ncbi:hypothetical protein [Streptomyces orinoci]|uniref:ABC transporter n=1 Tax=Streptomyces orinoci TaxID=67339 RepID=A0ABV3JXR6_STRON|nr:hypothetical protein [Streptomyces orinoci]